MSTAATSSRARSYSTVMLGALWCWGLAILATRHIQILDASIIAPAPPAWGFLSLPVVELLVILVAGAAIAFVLGRVPDLAHRRSAMLWVAATGVIPLLDVIRLAGVAAPILFWESVWFSVATGAAVGHLVAGASPANVAADPQRTRRDETFWVRLTWLATIVAGVWWYFQADWALGNFRLGFQDFGHFARRVVNTWEGRGFLSKTPSLPPFWDHFNPGLALLAPLWGLWPSPRMFLAVQAACLSLPSVFVYGIARRFRFDPLAACCWALAFLLFPAVGQMNLNYTYGWHPVSLAMPLMFAAIYGAVTRRWVTAAVCALLACSFNEAVLVALGCVAAAMVVSRVVQRGSDPDSDAARITEPVSGALSIAGWVAVWAVITVGFVLVWKFAGFSQFQQDRLASQLSWRHAIRIESVWFVLGLLTPVGVSHLGRAWPISLAIVVPMGVLLTWSYEHSTSLAFQYTSTLAPGLFVAAIAGASVRTGNACATEPHSKAPTRRAAAVLATTLVATSLFGAWPWSRPTLHLTEQLIYPGEQFSTNPQRAPGSAGIAALGEAVALASHPDAAVLATGYIAPHLLRVRRLEPLNEAANERAAALAAEAGEGRQWFELFDWIVLDTQEDFQQGMSLAKDVTAQALEAGYEIAFSRHGVIVLKSGQVVAR